MPLASSARLRRAAGALAILCLVLFILLRGKPYFTNASRPPRGIPDSAVAIQVARSLAEIDDILGNAPSPDREAMRFKQYIDFAFTAAYTALFLTLAAMLMREGGWGRMAGAAAMVCAVATGVFNVLQDVAILNILDIPLDATPSAAINAIRSPATAKWVLAAVTEGLLSGLFLKQRGQPLPGGDIQPRPSGRGSESQPPPGGQIKRWLSRATSALLLLSAGFIVYGFHDNRFFVYEGYPRAAAFVGIAVLFLLPSLRGKARARIASGRSSP
jgi:hypothetical protein